MSIKIPNFIIKLPLLENYIMIIKRRGKKFPL
jgi:hypothetical protein